MSYLDTLDIALAQFRPPLSHVVRDERAWTRDTIDPQECILILGEEAQKEVLAAALSHKIGCHQHGVALVSEDDKNQLSPPSLPA